MTAYKVKVLLFVFIILTSACRAQQPISKINVENIKIAGETYSIIRPDRKYVQFLNSKNKFSNTKRIAPNLPADWRYADYIKLDNKLITKICADAIPLSTLKQLPMGVNDDLYIRFKMSENGYPLELEFLMKNNSLITASQLAQIEKEIKSGKVKAIFNKDSKKFFKGANFFILNIFISYSDMLKAKVSE